MLAVAGGGLAGAVAWPAGAVWAASCAFLLLAAIAFGLKRQGGRSDTEASPAGSDRHIALPSQLADAVPEPLILFDAGGNVVHANVAARQAFGELDRGIPLLLKFRAPEIRRLIEDVLAGQSPGSIDYAERAPVERLYRVTAAAAGEGLFLLAFDDQSEAQRIDRMRADFVANASHELRTPLASIAGFVETLRGPARSDPAAQDRFLGIIQEQTARMSRLIDDLLSLSRLEMKARSPNIARIDLADLVSAVADSLKPLAEESSIAFERDLGRGSFIVEGDRDELFQVFENLIENACKYGQSGGRVVISAAHAAGALGREVELTVRDYGPGIPEEHIPRITERFYRVDVETSRTQKGTGLGLSIVKHILTRHRGRLSIRSRPGEGAAFTVHLPAA